MSILMKSNMIDPWCIDPFINFSHTADGYYRPCCIATVDRTNGKNIKDITPIEYFTGNEMKELRKDMLSRNFSDHTKFLCRQCFKNESEGVISRRIKENQKYKTNNRVQQSLKKFENDNYDSIIEDLEYVNFKILGNLCNLKCLMCGPSASSKIGAEWKKHDIFNSGNLKSIERIPYNSDSEKSYLENLSTILENIKRFSLVGGEAFINPNFNKIWDILKNNVNSKNLNLLIITNGTIIPQTVLDDASKFESLTLVFSIDGVNDRGSYVRSGLNWQMFDKNVKRSLKSTANVVFTVANSMLNIGYLDEIHDYLDSIGSDMNHVQWDAMVTEPAHLRSVNLPIEIKQQYLDKLESHFAFKSNKFNSVLDILKSDNGNNEDFLKGIDFLKKTDQIRKTNLLTYFPEFEKFYNK
jgi:MoaA/NifB/PqqE/SkfB family radical SAM enzyme